MCCTKLNALTACRRHYLPPSFLSPLVPATHDCHLPCRRFGFTLPYIAYPLVSIKKEFIASLREQLAAAGPDGFTGIVL